MQKISDTFCPRKWDELNLNLNYNYAYGCCKATPLVYQHNHEEILNPQKKNLLDGIKDSSCNYCWNVEINGGTSRRHAQLVKFDPTTYDQYVNNTVSVEQLEINIGNSCNLQCVYCNPTFSSLWEADIKIKSYPVFTDRYIYEIKQKNKKITEKNLDCLTNISHSALNIIGGEPLINNKFFEILEASNAKDLSFYTNLMVDRSTLDRLLSYQHKFQKINIYCSLDTSKDLSEFARYGINYDKFIDNLIYLLENINSCNTILLASLITNTTILKLKEFQTVPLALLTKFFKTFKWELHYCKSPRIHSLEALPDHLRPELISIIEELQQYPNIIGCKPIISALNLIKFDAGIFKQFKYFIEEFENRKNIKLPQDIKDILYAQTK
jgi:organic radical activating enzyme